MLRHERRLLIDCLGIGVALTLFVVAADAFGMLHRLDDFLYDLRARTCQRFTPTPTDTLVHVDIDDSALETIGRWPWPRATVAKILDEIRLAAPKAVEMDVLFTEPQGATYVPVFAASHAVSAAAAAAPPDAASAPTSPAASPATAPTPSPAPAAPAAESTTQPITFTRIDNDAELAAAMRRLGNVIVPATFEPMPRFSPLVAAMVDELRADLELDPDEVARRVERRGVRLPRDGHVEHFLLARREAMDLRLRALDLGPDTPFERVRLTLLPRTAVEIQTAAVNVLREQWTRHLVAREFRRFAWPRPPGLAAYAPMRAHTAPVRELAAAAGGGAFVDYPKFGSPVIRSLPLLLEMDGRCYPQMGLALACRMLEVDPAAIRVERGGAALVLHRPDGSRVVVPTAPPRVSTAGATYGNLIDIPWFGGPHWEQMYDWPAQRTSARHLPMNKVWEAVVTREKIVRNNAALDDAVRGVYDAFKDYPALEKYNAAVPPPDDTATREHTARSVLAEFQPFVDQYATFKPEELQLDDRVILASFKALRQTLELTPGLVAELDAHRRNLRNVLGGKALLVGWTATAAIADFVPTSLHEKCPGVVVHGVIYNGIMTGELWRTAPWWTAALTTCLLGALTAFTTARFAPLKALGIALAIAAAFAVVNGTLLFDRFNVLLSAAAPLVAIAAVWAACTLTRVVIEAAERGRITRRFSSYVDPKVVNYFIENPDATFAGETREMTVVFTDLAGFTAISERLGPKVVPMLNELFGELVPVIRSHDAVLNKFLGDGIMFFFNAPREMPSHAAVAVKAVLEMHEKVARFNDRLRGEGLPELSMRAGVMTADMIVGDAGGAGAADYTVLGDAVNTGARLEAANKATGTRTLISARTAEMLDGEFLVRPVGKLKVVGKDEAVMVYEPLARADRATDAQRELARCTAEMVDAYARRQFTDTLAVADALELRFGPSKLAAIYRTLAQQLIDTPPGPEFDGRIVLTEK